MKADLYSKLSKYVLYAFAAIILVVFALFFCVGEPLVLEQTSEAGEVTELPYPKFMELSLYLCYIMFIITTLLVLGFETTAAVKNMMHNKQGLMKKVIRVAIVAVIAIVLYLVSPTNLDFVLYLQYALFGAAALCMLGSFAISKMRS